MENENSSQDLEDLSHNLGGIDTTRSPLPSHRYHHQLYGHHEEDYLDQNSFTKTLIPSKSSTPFHSKFSVPHLIKNSNEDYHLPSHETVKSNENNEISSSSKMKIIDKKVSIEVILTEEHLKDLMKCKPTNEWISQTGKQLKYAYPTHLQQGAQTIKSLSFKKNLEPLPIDIQYNTIINWKGLQSDEKIQILYLKLLKYILFRESSLQRMEDLLNTLEQWYWKYSCLVIDRIQFRKSIISEELNQMVRIIHSKQQELSVAIAHYRTLSINVVEAIVR